MTGIVFTYEKMDEKVKAVWVMALRSGMYEQGRCFLRVADKTRMRHCCLGVLAELTAPKARMWQDQYGYLNLARTAGHGAALKSSLPRWLLQRLDLEPGAQLKLTAMNDAGATFDEIADWIEENL